jgi:4-alpha-glucanotransferase
MSRKSSPVAPPAPVLDRRRAGLLLHPTSLPGTGTTGDLGGEAFHFIDFLIASGISVWQMLPLGPTHADGSPYQCLSVHAGEPGLISLARLREWGWLDADPPPAADPVARAACLRDARHAYERQASAAERSAFAEFTARHAHWLEDYALYQALRRDQQGQPWWLWPAPLRDRSGEAMEKAALRLTDDLAAVRFEQYVFFRQWGELRHYANARGVLLFGDMPIFVAHDSADVWAQRANFALDAEGQPRVVAGVPPDYFSATGQRWGNPLYDWERLQADAYAWWLQRLRTQLHLFDLVRIDHFRGFEAYWEIPAQEQTAVNGRWVKSPGDALFRAMQREFHALPLVAEDLGIITPEVTALRERFGLPGMRILQFAFDGGAENPYLPHRFDANSVVYTGTHDNDTTRAWFDSLSEQQRQPVMDYLGFPGEAMPWPLIRAALASVARLAVLPMQDVLELGAGSRMNEPGTISGNWRWRFSWEQVDPGLAARLRHLVQLYQR